MGFGSRGNLGLLLLFKLPVHHCRYFSTTLPSIFSYPQVSESNTSGNYFRARVSERLVLEELSLLLSENSENSDIDKNANNDSIENRVSEWEKFRIGVETRIVGSDTENLVKNDGFLSEDDKLRGVFIQKLKGKASIEAALSSTKVNVTSDVVYRVLNKGNLGGEAMVTFFSWAITQPSCPKDLQNYNILLRSLGRRKYFDHMERVLHHMNKEGPKPSLETMLIVMGSYSRAHRVSKAIQYFENLEEFGLPSDTGAFNVFLKSLSERGHVRVATSLLHTFEGKIPFDTTTYTILIGGWSRLGRISETEKIWAAMLSNGFQPDCSTFNYLLEGLGRAGRIDNAIAVFESMGEKGCPPNTSSYNAMICNFISCGALNECVKYYATMSEKHCAPDIVTYTKMIGAFIKVCRVADALEMFDSMLGRGVIPSTGTLTSFIEPLCKFGPPHAALEIYRKAKKVGCKFSVKAYKLLLGRLARFGKCGTVLRVWDDMRTDGHSSDKEVYECVIDGFCNIGQLDNAVLALEEALSLGFCPNKVIYSKLNCKLLDASKVELAYKLYVKIKEARRNELSRKYWFANGWHF